MKTVSHMNTARDPLLHVETEGGIVNIRVGLRDDEGRPVTVVQIIRDVYAGEEWELDGCTGSRLVGPLPRKEGDR